MKAAEKVERRAYLGASDFAAILGIDRFRKPIDVWMEKTGRTEATDDEEEGPAAWGRFLERVLLERWMKETGLPLAYSGRRQTTFTHPDYPFIRATPDGYRRRLAPKGTIEYVVEAKTSRVGRGFGEAGTDEIPRYYKVQGIVQAAVTGAPVVHFPVLIAGQDFRRYVVEPTEQQRAAVIAAGVEFWNELVLPNVEPDEVSEEYLRQKWESDSGEDLVATDGDVLLVEAYRLARTNRTQAEAAEDERKLEVMQRIGDHARLLGPGFTISWKKAKDVEKTDWKLLAGDLEAMLHFAVEAIVTHDGTIGFGPSGLPLEEAITFVHSMHTETRDGSRVFRPTFHEEEESR